MEHDERDLLIAQYKDGYRAVSEALVKITDEELDASTGPGKWTVRQIVHHLADSEMTAAARFRLLVAEDRPAIKGYDQDRFASRLHYERPYQGSVELFRTARAASAELTACGSAEDCLPQGTPPRSGRPGRDTCGRSSAPHAHKQDDQIRSAGGAAIKK